jgi:hypothetical protein
MSTTFAESETPTGEIQAVKDQAASITAQPEQAYVTTGATPTSESVAIVEKATAQTEATAAATGANARTVANADTGTNTKTAASAKSETEVNGGADADTAVLMALADDGTITRVASAAESTHVVVPVDAPPDEVRVAPRKSRRRILADLLTYLAYALVALWVTSKLWPIGGHPVSAVDANDQAFFEWMLSHGAHVLTHGDSPLFTDRLNVPVGVNLMANTSILALSIPLAPITLLFGPAVSYALLIMLGLASTAGAWYYVLSRHIVASRSAAVIGGAIAGLGPGIVSHANGHPNIVAQFLVPFIAWRAVKLREPGRAMRNGVALGLLIAVQVFINEEMLFIVALAMGITLVAYTLMRWRTAKAHLRPFLAGAGVTALFAGMLVAYPLWRQFFGPGAYRGLNPAVQALGADLAAFPAFGSRTFIGEFTNNLHLASSQAEQNAFFGWPLLITFVVALFWLRRNALARALGVAAVLLSILSLGSKIIVDGRHTRITGPWSLLNDLPIFDSVVPTRLSLFVLPIIAVVIAMAHDRVLSIKTKPEYAARARQSRLAWCVLVGVSLLAALPTPVQTVPQAPMPTFFTQGMWKTYVAPDETVVPVPLPQAGNVTSMFWAADANLAMRLPAGYFLGPDPANDNVAIFGAPDRHTTALLNDVVATNDRARLKSADRKAAIADLKYWHAAVVIQLPSGPSEHAVRQTISDLLGFKPKFVGGVWVWDVRRLVSQRPALSG